jgi:hypothetical protein
MADTTSNIIIDTTGNTASMATDYGNSGTGLTATHLPLSKLVWGDESNGKRTTLTDPLPIQIQGQSGPVEVSGWIKGATTGTGGQDAFRIQNLIYGATNDTISYIAVAGNTLGTTLIGVTGTIQGISGGTPLEVTGGVTIQGAMGTNSVLVMGTSMGATANVNGETFGVGGFGIPIATTGGRRLNSSVDSVTVSGQVNVTGGWDMTSATDSVSVFGYDQGNHVYTKLFAGDGYTLGHSGDALNVNITNAGFTAEVTVSATTGVTNSGGALRVQGYSGSGDPITIRGEAAGAVDVVSNSGVNANVTNTVTIDDSNIIQSIEGSTGPLISTITDIKSNTNQIQAIRTDLTSGKVRTTIAGIIKPDEISSGSVPSTKTPTPLHNNTSLKSGITIKSSPNNNYNIMIGSKTLVQKPSQGYLLEPGESIYLEVDNINKIFHVVHDPPAGVTLSEIIHYIGS